MSGFVTAALRQQIKWSDLFGEPAPENPAIAELKALEISETTPVQAMIKLEQLQKLARA